MSGKNLPDVPPSAFVRMGQPNCSRWGKSEVEWIAFAYVQALAKDGDTWKSLTRERCYELLTDDERRFVGHMLTSDYEVYEKWFNVIKNQITDSQGAWGVGGFWDDWNYKQTLEKENLSENSPYKSLLMDKLGIQWLPVDCDISDAAIAECLERMGPERSPVYTLYCGQRAFSTVRSWIRNATWDMNRSPFHPQVNVCVEPLAKPGEWVLVAGDKRIGSHGIS